MGPRADNSAIPWDSVQISLRELGYELVRREGPAVQHLLPLYEVRETGLDLAVIAGGKGPSDEASRASALAEAVERILGALPRDRCGIISASATELGPVAVSREELSLGGRDALTPNMQTDWVEGQELSGASRVVPAELVYTNVIPACRVSAISYRNTSGLAAGATTEDALLNGILEIAERDCFWTVMKCRLQTPSIPTQNLVHCIEPRVRAAIDEARAMGLRLHLKDISLDWPIPVVHAVLEHVGQRAPTFARGSGAGLTMEQAVTRAVCEAFQVRSDLERLLAFEQTAFVLAGEMRSSAAHYWADPLWGSNLAHLLTASSMDANPAAAEAWSIPVPVSTLLDSMTQRGIRIWWTSLGEIAAVKVVRVIAIGAVWPDPRGERPSGRLKDIASRSALASLFIDPVVG
ncbi:MAG: YcaO-like family protein [Gemmatimonadales bacterium]